MRGTPARANLAGVSATNLKDGENGPCGLNAEFLTQRATMKESSSVQLGYEKSPHASCRVSNQVASSLFFVLPVL